MMMSKITTPSKPSLLLVGNHCALNEALYRRYVCADYVVTWLHPEARGGSIGHFLGDLKATLDQERPTQMIVSPAPVMPRAERLSKPALVLQAHLLAPAQTIELAFNAGVPRLLFVGSHDIYPGGATLPNAEEDVRLPRDITLGSELATGHLACIQMCAAYSEQGGAQDIDYRSVVMADVFGPGEVQEQGTGKVVHALIDRMHRARLQGFDRVVIQGDGSQRRDWLFAADAAEAAMQTQCLTRDSYRQHTLPGLRHLGAGSGGCLSLMELAGAIARTVGYEGHVVTQHSGVTPGPDQQVDDTRLRRSGWRPRVSLEAALRQTYEGYLKSKLAATAR